jgi:hypothetical protein
MAAGYSGGDLGPAGDELLVRQANAHTWVEVWLGPDRGWEIFDPTPAAAVPGFGADRNRMGMRALWEWVQASWDRYVLTYGVGDQLRLLEGIGDALLRLVAHLDVRAAFGAGAGAVLLWLGLGPARRLWWSRGGRRRRPPAAEAMEGLRRRLLRNGVDVPVSATVRWVAGHAAGRWPEVADAIEELVVRAEGELYGTGGWGPVDRRVVGRQWSRVRAAMRGRAATAQTAAVP